MLIWELADFPSILECDKKNLEAHRDFVGKDLERYLITQGDSVLILGLDPIIKSMFLLSIIFIEH